jgi:K+-sensing histidine kinase KdpD
MFVVLSLCTALLGMISIVSLRWIAQNKDHVITRLAKVELGIQRLETLNERRARKLRTYLLSGELRLVQERQALAAEFEAIMRSLAEGLQYPDEQGLLNEISEANRQVRPVADGLIALKEQGAGPEEIQRAFQIQIQPAREELEEAIARLSDQVKLRNEEELRRANRRAANAATALGSTVALALIAAVLLGLALQKALRGLAVEQEALAAATGYQQEVMGIIGHDLRSPLAALIATASLASRQASSPEEQRRSGRILRCARRIEALSTVLLDFTRLTLGRGVPVVLQEEDLHELVAERVSQTRADRGTPRIVHEHFGDGHAQLDSERIGQAMEALLTEALAQATPGSEVRVRSRGDGPSVAVELTALEVNAVGRPAAGELLPRLFEPLTPASGGQEPVKLSSGFGLYMAREVVTAHAGTLDVRATDEGGLCFRVHLPRVPRQEARALCSAGRTAGARSNAPQCPNDLWPPDKLSTSVPSMIPFERSEDR